MNKNKKKLLRDFNEAINDYHMLLLDAIDRNDKNEIASIRRELQSVKRQRDSFKGKPHKKAYQNYYAMLFPEGDCNI